MGGEMWGTMLSCADLPILLFICPGKNMQGEWISKATNKWPGANYNRVIPQKCSIQCNLDLSFPGPSLFFRTSDENGESWYHWRMASSGTLRRVALVRTDNSEELRTCFIRVKRVGILGTTLAVTSNRRTLRRNTTWAKHSRRRHSS
jgi:hypothetical protein